MSAAAVRCNAWRARADRYRDAGQLALSSGRYRIYVRADAHEAKCRALAIAALRSE